MFFIILKRAKATKAPTPAPIIKINKNLGIFNIPEFKIWLLKTLTSGSAIVANKPKIKEKNKRTVSLENLLTEFPTNSPICITDPSTPVKNRTSPSTITTIEIKNLKSN